MKKIWLLTLVIFCMTTSELFISGLLTEMALFYNTSISKIGMLITYYALSMAIVGPILTIVFIHVNPKKLLVYVVSLFILGQFIGGFTSNYLIMVFSRIITGGSASVAIAVSLNISFTQVSKEKHATASSIVMSGLMLASIIGLPVSTFVGHQYTWQVSYISIAVLLLISIILVIFFIPQPNYDNNMKVEDELKSLKSGPLWLSYTTAFLIISATFGISSFFEPILTKASTFTSKQLPLLLSLYGISSLIGNFIVGKLGDKYTLTILKIGCIQLIIAFALLATFINQPFIVILSIVLFGLSGISLNPATIVRVTNIAGRGTAVMTLLNSMITFGVVIGTYIGNTILSMQLPIVFLLISSIILAILAFLTVSFDKNIK
ncbi:MAG: MFS transporter [Staphylococcus capitis]|uniref:MFS transporter n=1 Tax=Staphylococcus epidermidis TaxID=1282 RepID=UPI00254DBE05|nr:MULTISPECIES: MFS transporter [Staphylococcus]MDK8530466.1 MFS transporter [Staphylococcus capitis]